MFTAMLRKIPCKSKTVCLDVVHSQKPKDTLFRTRVMYPQPDIYDKVANLGDAVCIGSCMSGLTGAAAARYMKNNEVEEAQDLKMKQMEEEAEKKKRLAPFSTEEGKKLEDPDGVLGDNAAKGEGARKSPSPKKSGKTKGSTAKGEGGV